MPGVGLHGVATVLVTARNSRSYELRAAATTFDRRAARLVAAAVRSGTLQAIANDPDTRDPLKYADKEHRARSAHRIPTSEALLFIEVTVDDASQFAGRRGAA